MERICNIIRSLEECCGPLEALDTGLYEMSYEPIDFDDTQNFEVLAYDAGEVTFEDGEVETQDLIKVTMNDGKVYYMVDRWVDIRLILDGILPN